jgi:glycosyltransferase involved in cell wall biosynthesis
MEVELRQVYDLFDKQQHACSYMRKILLLAYACEPNMGSEKGVGWNVAKQLTENNEVHVLTRGYCKDKIQSVVDSEQIDNLHFHYYDIPKYLFFNESKKWGEQINYIIWQIKCRRFVKKLHRQFGFDIVHHITFCQYRTPSPGFYIDIPFVMGPIGGAEHIAASFDNDLESHTSKKERIRKRGTDLKIFSRWVKKKKNKKYFLFSTNENLVRLTPYCNDYPVALLPTLAFDPADFENFVRKERDNNIFEMLYAGRAEDWKGIRLFLRALKLAFTDETSFKVKLIGIRTKEEQVKVESWINELGLNKCVDIIPFLPRETLLKKLSESDLFVYPAFRDSGSMAILEACVLGCPTLCFAAGGQDAFPDDILIKAPVAGSYAENLDNFAQKLKWIYHNKDKAKIIGEKSKEYVYEHFTWESKIGRIETIYDTLLAE